MSDVMERTDLADHRRDTVSEHQEVIRAIEPAVADHLSLLLPLDRAWQPTDYLPDLEIGELAGRGRRVSERQPRPSPMSCWSSWWATWSPKKRSPVTRSRSTDWSGTTRAPARLPGRDGCVAGPPRKTATVICSTPTSVSPAACTCAPWNGRSTASSPTASIRRAGPIPTASWSTPRFRSAPRACRTATSGGSPPGTATRTSPGSAA